MSTRIALAAALCLLACDHADPPRRPTSSGTTSTNGAAPHERRLSQPKRAPGEPVRVRDSGVSPDGGGARDAGIAASDAATGDRTLVPPALVAPDGSALPQTADEPTSTSAWFNAGVRALFRAIQENDPTIAEPFFFPIVAYEKVKDVKDPKRDWERRLLANFRRDIRDYNKRLGAKAGQARFVGLELAKDRMKWMKPRSEGNKLGYFRVTRNRLRYETSEGKPATLEVTSLISWRGEWYLVHLNGFE